MKKKRTKSQEPITNKIINPKNQTNYKFSIFNYQFSINFQLPIFNYKFQIPDSKFQILLLTFDFNF